MSFLATLVKPLAPILPITKRLLFRFHGGVFPKYNKSLSTRNPIYPPIIPQELILPMPQAIGEKAIPLVKVGDRVLKNQLLAQAQNDASKKLVVPIHAPTSGIITAIEPRVLPHASGLTDDCIVLAPDQQDQAITNVLEVDGSWPEEPQALKDLLARSGIIGMGGAGFPTYAKIQTEKGKVKTLLINGAECEPFISCDDLLMQTQAKAIWLGAQITAKALGASEIRCGIENNKPKAIAMMQKALKSLQTEAQMLPMLPMHIHQVATVYPMGGQKQLIFEMTGVEITPGGHAVEQGMLMMNVATYRAIYRAVKYGEPLTSRLVTVSGEGLADGFNIEALIGTPFNELTDIAKPKEVIDYPLIMGGPMMGVQMQDNHVPVLKTTNCVLANPPEPRQLQMPCIRCGECMDACPVNLLPQQMYWHTQGEEYEKVEKLKVFDCIECGCCSYVCPSQIPLVQYYRHAKSEINLLNAEKQAAEVAKQRHEFRQARIEREKAEREARLKAKKAAVKKQASASASLTAKPKAQASSAAAAKAAAARAAAKKATANKATDKTLSTTVQTADKPMSAREKAILAAQAAAAKKQGQTDKDKKTKGQSLGSNRDRRSAADAAKKRAQQAAAKAAAAKRAKKTLENDTTTENLAEPEGIATDIANNTEAKPLSARDRAIAAAKAAVAKKQTKNQAVEPIEQEEKAIESDPIDLTASTSVSTPALEKELARKAAIEKARKAAQARRQTKALVTESATDKSTQESIHEVDSKAADKKQAARQAAMAAAKRAAAKNTTNQQNRED